jgi:hypothetical protein
MLALCTHGSCLRAEKSFSQPKVCAVQSQATEANSKQDTKMKNANIFIVAFA